jgi:hypothetical protein
MSGDASLPSRGRRDGKGRRIKHIYNRKEKEYGKSKRDCY